MPGSNKKESPEESAGPSWGRMRSDKEMWDPKSLFQPDPHMKGQLARQAFGRGDIDAPALTPQPRHYVSHCMLSEVCDLLVKLMISGACRSPRPV